ncbi:hypothetical protein EN817_20790 [Mesorhizobium sp. M3A.F.Ca.ET.174.01.1.1]|uniref:hypothetical protein n=1 Tax=unclassified Mesorhizobium TaxID=325217 RepID=UPI001093E5B5|nr:MULTISPECIES: hypothetical protein [unclassified Mesorhizobium]TGS85776.1 hypothetical protein EN818_17550 [Mesorhizobium sp. M3A.F.Ca.ET.175.01.1.1]TGT23914.1 hypothetical protein EN817_20790 [Mesorhizobium sp. M3A.F.Ca.ET.174.01.1.1]
MSDPPVLDASDFSSFSERLASDRADLNRKLRLLASKYKAFVKGPLEPRIAEQHNHMFGLSISDLPVHRSRSGLIITEILLGTLMLDINKAKIEAAVSQIARIRPWADLVYKEWKMAPPGAGVGPGRWWVLPVLYEFIGQPTSTVRSVVIGLEAMGMVESKKAHGRPNAKTRAKAVRITRRGEDLFRQLEAPFNSAEEC